MDKKGVSFAENEHKDESMNELLEKSLTELTESIKTRLEELSKTVNIDPNTLWIAFISSMKDLENAFKREYP